MRLLIPKEISELEKIYDPYLKRNDNGVYISSDAPKDAKDAFSAFNNYMDKATQAEIESWFN